MADFCDRLIAARLSAGLTQSQLARDAKVSRTTIVSWEKNPHQQHEHDKLERVARALGKEPSDLQPDGEPAPITTPARLHSWLNEHLETVIVAEVQRRLMELLAQTPPMPPESLIFLQERVRAFAALADTGSVPGLPATRGPHTSRTADPSPPHQTAPAKSTEP